MTLLRTSLTILLFFSCQMALALGPLHLSPFASAGLGKAKLENESKSPNIAVYQIGGTAGYKVIPWGYIGFSSSLQFTKQFSSTSKSFGNRKGTRLDFFCSHHRRRISYF